MTMKRIYALPIIAALILCGFLCGCSKEITVIPQADIPSETADETAGRYALGNCRKADTAGRNR